jgi:hypothetical protein
VTDDSVRLIPGDDVYIAADQNGDALVNLRRVPAPAAPMNVIHLVFAQQTLSGTRTTTLDVDNFFTRQLVYHAAISDAATSGASNTDTCPVPHGITDDELWSQPLAAIVVRDFLFKDGDQPCTYY